MQQSQCLTQTAAGEYLRSSRWTVRRLIASGDLRLGPQSGVPKSSLQELLNASKVLSPNGGTTVARELNLPDLFTLEEVAAKTPYTLRSLQDGARQRRFDHYHIGGQRLMSAEQVEALLASRLTKANNGDMAVDPAIAAELERRANRGRRPAKAA